MRRKPGAQGGGGYNNQRSNNNRPRYQGSNGGGEFRGNGGGNRPRKNYSALREKYLGQARDAQASGDRVLAENYFQHADHCYRMMVEEGYNNRPQPVHNDQQQQPQSQEAPAAANDSEEHMPASTSALPAFLTGGFENAAPAIDPATIQSWEERDA